MAARAWLVHGLIALVGILGVPPASKEIRGHVGRLIAHLQSGSWETVSDRPHQEAFVRRSYAAEPGKWVVSFISATGQSWLLDDASRADTIKQLGHWALEDAETFSFRRPEIFRTYRLFLAEALAETAAKLPAKDRIALDRLANTLRQSRHGRMSVNDRALFRAVVQALDGSPLFRELAAAVQVYEDYEMTVSAGSFDKFHVFTDPPYDEPTRWRDDASRLESNGRCQGTAHAYAAQASPVAVDFTSHPQLLRVRLDRPWLSDQLLDKLSTQAGPNTSKYFGERGDLGIIPTEFWVLMPERVWFKGVSQADQERLQTWANDNTCCRLVCGSAEIRLDTHEMEFSENREDKRLVSLRADVPPLLFAVASRRRVP